MAAQHEHHAPAGILAIWNECRPGCEEIYEEWYRTEHLAERLAIPGFRLGRRFRHIAGPGCAYFTCYETDSPAVLFSDAYQARVNDPTALTRTVMDRAFTHVTRSLCRIAFTCGMVRGACAVTLCAPDPDGLLSLASRLAADPDAARVEVWVAEPGSEGDLSAEQRLRGKDDRIAGCLVVETLLLAEAERIADRLAQWTGVTPDIYTLLCDLYA